MTPAESVIANKILTNAISLYRLTAGERKKVIKILLKMEKELTGNLYATDLAIKRQAEFLLKESAKIIDDYYDGIHAGLDETLTGLAKHTANVTSAAVEGVAMSTVMPTIDHLKSIVSDVLILGSPTKDWWEKQAEDVKFKFNAAVRQGIVQGDSTNTIALKVKDIIKTTEAGASALVHTSVQTVSNDARMAFFKENGDNLLGVQQLSTFDGHTSNICIAYSGASYDMSGNPINGTTLPMGSIPRHFNCRSVWVPLLKSSVGLAPGTRFSEKGFIKANTTMDEFLKMKTAEEVDAMLGKGKAQLWRDGKITLSDLINQRGRPLTLKELENLHK